MSSLPADSHVLSASASYCLGIGGRRARCVSFPSSKGFSGSRVQWTACFNVSAFQRPWTVEPRAGWAASQRRWLAKGRRRRKIGPWKLRRWVARGRPRCAAFQSHFSNRRSLLGRREPIRVARAALKQLLRALGYSGPLSLRVPALGGRVPLRTLRCLPHTRYRGENARCANPESKCATHKENDAILAHSGEGRAANDWHPPCCCAWPRPASRMPNARGSSASWPAPA